MPQEIRRNPVLRFLAACAALAGALLARPALANTVAHNTPGNWTFTVPSNVYSVTVVVSGGGGGGGGYDTAQSGNGGAATEITATIAVLPGQVLSGTVAQGGSNGFTGGTSIGFGTPCLGGGTGGAGAGNGGGGGNANCAGNGYSGGGGGGGGASTLLIDGTAFIIAGGGGGAGGDSLGAPGSAGADASGYSRPYSCGTGAAGAAGESASYDGSGGGGGGGGYAGGSGGASAPDHLIAGGGAAGTSCIVWSGLITAISSGTGAAGGIAPTAVGISSNGSGLDGSITITYSVYSGPVGRHQDCATESGNGGGPATTPASAKSTTTCVVPYSTNVHYYTHETMGYSQAVATSVGCSNGVFGDPDSGAAKICTFEVIALGASQSVTNINATVGSAITATAPATGTLGLAPYYYAISPALPAGLTMNAATGVISGTPTAASPTTIYTITITDTANQSTFDAVFTAAGQQTSQSVTRTFALTVTAPVSVTRTATLVSDPVNGSSNPKDIPGAILRFEITVSNIGPSALGDGSMFLSDALSPHVSSGTGALPTLTQGSPSSNLTFNAATDVAYSNSASAPATFAECTYTPVSSYDPGVRHICFNPKGSMSGSSGTAPSFTIAYNAQVK